MASSTNWLASWTPSTTTYISPTSIATSHASSLESVLKSAISAASTETHRVSLYSLSQILRGAEASLTVINAEKSINALPTTATSQMSVYSGIIEEATLNLKDLMDEENNFGGPLNLAGNTIFTVFFGLAFIMHLGLLIRSGYYYFGVCLSFFTALEFGGYLARALAVDDLTSNDKFLCQIVCLTISPAFLMGGIYYYLAQVVVIHGRHYSVLKPLWFTYIFVCCDVLSLVIQGVGGGVASSASTSGKSSKPGTHIMVAGIAFQVVSMSLFLVLYIDFVWRSFFKANPAVQFSFANFFHVFFNTPKGSKIRASLEPFYAKTFRESRQNFLYPYIPLALFVSIIFVYIRCIYRVIELAQGWSGYLITHEAFVLTLDALMVLIACLIYIPFHPFFIFGKNKLSFSKIRRQDDLPTESDFASLNDNEVKRDDADLD